MRHIKKILILFATSIGIACVGEERTTWGNTYFVWNFSIISKLCKALHPNPEEYFAALDSGRLQSFNKKLYKDLEAGDVVWVPCRFIPQFCAKILPKLKCPIVLLIADGDESFPSDCKGEDFKVEQLLDHKYIVHIFAQNCDYSGNSKKVTHLPVGIDFHTCAYRGRQGGWGEKGSPGEQEACLMNILGELEPTYLRKKGAFVDFQWSDTMHASHKRYLQFGEDRASIFQRLLPTGLIEHGPWMRRFELWRTKGQYAFSISPHGNGLDCIRTWEDLALGCIVIVKTSPLDPMYRGLPVVIIHDWAEITSENLDKWLLQYGDAFTNPSYRKKLTNDYWLSEIEKKTGRYRNATI